MHRTFYLWLSLLSGVVLLGYMMLAGYREMRPEWHNFQRQYQALMVEKATDEATRAKARALTTGIQQLYLANLGRVDRCTNCHLGVENPLMADAQLPLKQHSGDYLKHHPPEQFGCTICHNGQGRATNKDEAHGAVHEAHWDRPIIPTEYIQSACATCHDFDALKNRGGGNVVQGRDLFLERGCKGCHKLDGVGGVLGKALDGVGSQPAAYFPMKNVEGEKTVYTWMKEHFEDPRNVVAGSQMIGTLSDAESGRLTTYILSLQADEVPKKYRRQDRTPGAAMTEQSGERLYKMYCIACHTTGLQSVYDEVFAKTIPAIMNPAFLAAVEDTYLKANLSEGRADTPMTAWKADAAGLSDTERDRILGHVTRNRPPDRPEAFGVGRFDGDPKHGENLYKVRCMSCHGDSGQGGVGLNLRNPVVQKADPEFLAITVRDGREKTHMAAFGKTGVGLRDEDIADVVTYVRALADRRQN
jgi:mono/diheme cytochrome c family protein